MKEAQNHIRKYLAEVAIREMKRAAVKAGKPWPPKNRKPLKLS
jgi:hypothetical protein